MALFYWFSSIKWLIRTGSIAPFSCPFVSIEFFRSPPSRTQKSPLDKPKRLRKKSQRMPELHQRGSKQSRLGNNTRPCSSPQPQTRNTALAKTVGAYFRMNSRGAVHSAVEMPDGKDGIV